MEMRKNQKKTDIPIEIVFTEGYEKRFTLAILKIHANRKKNLTAKIKTNKAVGY